MKKNDKQKPGKIENEELENLENQLKRALADYQNLERRIEENKRDWILSSNKDLILKLLPGIDNLVLAEKHTQDEGVKLSIKHFLDTLENEGVRKIETLGLDFNPKFMEAVDTAQGEEGKVLEEIKSGYTLYDQVLRPAQVVVGKQD